MDSTMFDQAIIGAIAMWLINLLKCWDKIPWVREGATKIVRTFSALVAMVSASGILIAANWQGAEGTLNLAITGLTAHNIALFLWMSIKSFVVQQGWWTLLKAAQAAKTASATAVVVAIK